MDIKEFLNTVCDQIKYKPIRGNISDELKSHIEEKRDEYVTYGLSCQEAEERAILQMGSAEEIGKNLNKIHRPRLDWKIVLLIMVLMGFGILVAILQQTAVQNNRMKSTITYMLIGTVLSIFVYFSDYRKMKKYSNLFYLLATLIMLLPFLGLKTMINGVQYAKIGNITFMTCLVAIPFYLIAFCGYITNYQKENVIKIEIENKKIKINKDFIKLFILCIISIGLMIEKPSIANAMILSLAYLVMITIKIIQNQETRKRNLAKMYGTIFILGIVLVMAIMIEPYRWKRIEVSFNPETDPWGAGYVGMLKKEILENAKWIGEAETKIISSDEFIISKESNYTFIYLLGKTGVLVSGLLVITIIFLSVKLILNTKKIKDKYGKMLTIGFGTLYISQSVASVLMNLNLGLQMDINLPFVSYGGVYFIINMVSISMILSIYRRKDINLYEKTEDIKAEERV